jgi:nicotinate phosphoribosyltransferase
VAIFRGRPVAEFGLRRSQAPFAAARAAFIGGCETTSFLGAARAHGLTPSGTIPHALVQAFDDAAAAFRAVAESFDRYSLLLDTYDVAAATERAIAVAREARERFGHTLAAVRLDSGDIASQARSVRRALDEAGLTDVRIVASGGLDEFRIDLLMRAGAPIDAFGVGENLGSGSGSVERRVPGGFLSSCYKLVWYEGGGVSRAPLKHAGDKSTWPGRKQVWRGPDADLITLEDEPPPPDARALLEPVVRGGAATGQPPALKDIRIHASASLEALPERYRELTRAPAYPVRRSEGLRRLREETLRAHGLA